MRKILVLALGISVVASANAVARDRKGIVDNGPTSLFAQSNSQLHATIRDFQQLGVGWVRLDFDWSMMEPSPGRYNVARYDGVVKALADAGIDVLGLVAYTPAWARGGTRSKFFPPDRDADYASFARYLAARYAPLGVHAWEIWNEENSGQFWQPAPSPPRYARLLRQAYLAIHAADAAAIVLLGGLAQPRNSPTSITAFDYLRKIYQTGAAPFFDAVADHPYSSPRMPSDQNSSNNWQRMFATSPSLHGIMSEYGDKQKKIWITEYGAATHDSDADDQPRVVITEDQQANLLRQAYGLVKNYLLAGPLFWYEYQDLCPISERTPDCFYGLIRFDGSRKPSYQEYRAAPGR